MLNGEYCYFSKKEKKICRNMLSLVCNMYLGEVFMKKLLSVFLSMALLFSSSPACFAKSNPRPDWQREVDEGGKSSRSSSSKDKVSILKGKNGSLTVEGKGDKMTFVINNKSESSASASASASGSSALTKFVMLAIKLGVGIWLSKKALDVFKSFGTNISKNVSDGFSSLGNLFSYEHYQKFKQEYEQRSQSGDKDLSIIEGGSGVGQGDYSVVGVADSSDENLTNLSKDNFYKFYGKLNSMCGGLKQLLRDVGRSVFISYIVSCFTNGLGMPTGKIS